MKQDLTLLIIAAVIIFLVAVAAFKVERFMYWKFSEQAELAKEIKQVEKRITVLNRRTIDIATKHNAIVQYLVQTPWAVTNTAPEKITKKNENQN